MFDRSWFKGYYIGAGKGGLGSIVGWFIRVIIYDIIVTSISDILGVSRMVALFIFLGVLLAGSAVAYVLKQRMSPSIED